MAQHSIQTDGHCLSILTHNEEYPGIPIVFLHGITLAADFWLPTLPTTLATTPCYFINLPAHYPSEILPEAKVLHRAIQAVVGDRPVILVGYSAGGLAALSLAAYYPTSVSRVLCISGSANGQWNGIMGVLQRLCCMGHLGIWLFKLIYKLFMFNPVLYRWISGLFAGDRSTYFDASSLEPTLSAVYSKAIHHSSDDLAYLFRSFASMDLSEELSRIQSPVLILAGDCDSVISHRQTQHLAKTIPQVELQVLSGMGHMFFAERLTEYQQVLTSWVSHTN
jgi:pimeloyl-ACP methyl ester carboxylesterase